MDLIQVLCYRVLHLIYWCLSVLGIVTLPLFTYDTSEYVRDNEEQSVFRGTYRQVHGGDDDDDNSMFRQSMK